MLLPSLYEAVAGEDTEPFAVGMGALEQKVWTCKDELQRQLLVTSAGVQENRSGWPSALFELTCHRFTVGGGQNHGMVASRFLDTMLEVTPADLPRAVRWPIAQAGPSSTSWSPRAGQPQLTLAISPCRLGLA